MNAPLDFELQRLEYDHPYLREREFTDETIKTFGLGYCHRGLMKGRIAIPLHDKEGALIGYAGRIVDEEAIGKDTPRYLFPGSRERGGTRHEFRKSAFLYNGFRVGKPVPARGRRELHRRLVAHPGRDYERGGAHGRLVL